MKKLFPLLLLSMCLGSLVGCTPSGGNDGKDTKKDPNAISKISFSGSMKKKHYSYDDEWDITGLSVKATTYGETTSVLSKDKYNINFNKRAPKNLTNVLQITAQLKENLLKTASVAYKDVIVDDEVYDNAAEVSAYYSGVNLNYTGTSLLKELQSHSFKKHTYFVKYGETTNLLAKSNLNNDYEAPDLIPGKHKIEMFYTNKESDYYVGTREHVWACNDSSGLWPHPTVDESDYIGGGSDLYHIRPSTPEINTARGDAPFVDFDDSEFSSKKSQVVEVGDDGPYKLKLWGATPNQYGKYEFAELVEPADEVKGDIARIVAYIYMHYNKNGGSNSSMVGTLNLTKVLGFNSTTKAKSILKQWNNLDPVSPVETRRNHTVQQIQGNRNPFVDHPELIDKAF